MKITDEKIACQVKTIKHTLSCISSNSSIGVTLSDKACVVNLRFSFRYRNVSFTHSIKASILLSDCGNAAYKQIRKKVRKSYIRAWVPV
jgi:hypothetical protein